MKNCLSILIIFSLSICIFDSFAQNIPELWLRAEAEYLKGNYFVAAQNYKQYSKENGKNIEIKILAATCYYKADSFFQALEILKELPDKQTQEAVLLKARCYAQLNDKENTFKCLELYMLFKDKVSPATIKTDSVFRKFKQTKDWAELWKKDWYSNYELLLADAQFAAKEKNYLDAYESLNKAIKLKPDKAQAYILRANFQCIEKMYASALKDYTKAIELSDSKYEILISRGLAYIKDKKFSKAIQDFSEVLTNMPGKIECYKFRAQAFNGEKKYEEALADIQFYLKYCSFDNEAQTEMANIYTNNSDYFSAIVIFSDLLKNNPKNAKYYTARGILYMKTNTLQYAINDFSTSLDLMPNQSVTYFNRGLAYYTTGNIENAINDWKRAALLGSTAAKEYLSKYEK